MKKIFAFLLVAAMLVSLFAVAPAAADENIALGCSYDTKGYVISEGQWPASYNANLTDGVAKPELSYEADDWFGFCNSESDNPVNAPDKIGAVTIDLGSSKSFKSIKVNTYVGSESGITKPVRITAYVSDNKSDFESLGDFEYGEVANNVAWAILNAEATGRYVKIEVELSGFFAFINEIEIYTGESSGIIEDQPDILPEYNEAYAYDTEGNVALNKTYDAKGFKCGGEWPANYIAPLTDGQACTEVKFDNNWFAFCTSEGDYGFNTKDGVGAVTIDLEKVYDIASIKVNTAVGENIEGAGLNTASKITAYISNSADSGFTKLGDLTIGSSDTNAAWATLNTTASGRYVKIEVTLNGTFAFINEIAVYEAAGSDVPPESSEVESSEVESSEVESSEVESSEVESSEVESSEVESSEVESSEVESSEVESSEVESSEVESSEVESSEVESSEVESSEVVSSEVESSEVVSSDVESSEVVSSDVESSDVETPDVESSDIPEDEPVEITNVALGKDYDAEGYKCGGEWPADYTAGLTDGKAAAELSFDNNWFAFCTSAGDNGLNAPNGVGTVIIDLGANYDISAVRVNTLFGNNVDGSGVNSASKITAYVSDSENGEYTKIGDLTADVKEGVAWAETAANATGRFVKVEVTLNGIFAFINEIEVLGAEAGSIGDSDVDAPTADQPTGDQPTDDQTDTPTGDASSMIFFAIIALIAIAGSAVVIKTRR